MNKFVWLSAPLMFVCSETIFAACTQPQSAIFSYSTNEINQFSYNQTFPVVQQRSLSDCNPPTRVNSYFSSRLSDLTGSSPFGVNAATIQINGSAADTATLNDAKAWLAANLKITFNIRDASTAAYPATNILALTDYRFLPETVNRPTVPNTNGVRFYVGAGNGVVVLNTKIETFTVNFTNTTKPAAAIINALNGATVRIHLGTHHYIYGPYDNPSVSTEVSGSVKFYADLRLNFNFPTCTVANQIVNLATVPTSMLNSQQTANEQNFNVNINCPVAMPSKVLLATIKDSYTPSNINSNGILKNHPSLANRSNVDIQLSDASDTPLEIGSQHSFYSIPAGSTATTFIKALKARYFRSTTTATPGFVQTQATVSLDYQ
ncbi:fimbrial protein [Acinetobacter guillouiae]|uniref:fimbrial protein n=1 Tax=Acinetobacter guillouiae TaxID=106649 RepID=UPI0012503FE8|nr:fimbrial protein [Acinetobacter guillouiae]